MESSPASSFEMGEAEFALGFLIVACDAPAQFRGIDENFDRSVFGQGREPVFGRLALVFGHLDQQPCERLWAVSLPSREAGRIRTAAKREVRVWLEPSRQDTSRQASCGSVVARVFGETRTR